MRRSTAGMWWSEGSRRAPQFIARQGGLDCAVAIPRLIRESRRQRLIDSTQCKCSSWSCTERACCAPVARVGRAVSERIMTDLTRIFTERGDLAHLALFLWASGASALLIFTLRELAAAMRRFDDFVRELSRFNRKFGGR